MLRTISDRSIFKVSVALLSSAFTVTIWDKYLATEEDWWGIYASEETLGGIHLAEDFPDHLIDNIVQNVHGVSGGAVTFRLLSGLAVADIADAGRFVHGAIPQAAVLSAGGKAQPCTAVTTEHIASQQGLSSGIQRNRGLLPCMVSPLLPDSLGSFKLLGCNNL